MKRFIIIVYCSSCGFKLYEKSYKNTTKYKKEPSIQLLFKLSKSECPICGKQLLKRPRTIKIMTLREFNERYDNKEFFIEERKHEV